MKKLQRNELKHTNPPLAFSKSAAFLLKRRLLALSLGAALGLFGLLGGCGGTSGRALTSEQTQQTDQALSPDRQAFHQLTDDIFRDQVDDSLIDLHYSLSAPETFGIQEAESLYGEVSLQAVREDLQCMKDYQTRLHAIRKSRLNEQEQLDYAILEAFLKTERSLEGLEGFFQPLAPTIGVQAQLPILLAEYAFYNPEDVEDYLSLLAGLDDYFGQLLTLEQEKAGLGLGMTEDAIQRVIDSCTPYLTPGKGCILTGTFEERLQSFSRLSEEQKKEYTRRHDELVARSFIPAYQHLIAGLEQLKGTDAAEGGLCHFPGGKEYYRYLVFSSTGTSCRSVDTLRKSIEKRLRRDSLRIAELAAEQPDLLDRYAEASFSRTEPEDILNHLRQSMAADFPEPICADYSLHYVPKVLEPVLSPAFYLTPPMDLAGHNTIYINPGSAASGSSQLFSTLAHEGYPGHLYQTSYFIQQNPAPFRHLLSFPAYSEGWATYVESLSYQMDSGLDPAMAELKSLNSLVNLGIHAYLDIMVNDQGWKIPEISEYISQYYDDPEQTSAAALYHAMVDNPTNYLEYYVGYLEFSDMREKAEKTLKEDFSAKEFHRFLLDVGPAPFSVIRKELSKWLRE
ncbi:MAG: DUF885 domain-containing protein [Lachnospiraceae bacterium]|nr:DUF885 domain-containing protein [Lachnospiraceae bacterium]